MRKMGRAIGGGIGVLILAGGAGGFWAWNHDPALKQLVLSNGRNAPLTGPFAQPPANAPTSVQQPPANAPVGFNATRTAFVLPHHLGYLPAPELALAKSDPAYAAGLANLKNWIANRSGGHSNYVPGENTRWIYSTQVGQLKEGIGPVAETILVPSSHVETTTALRIDNSTPRKLPTQGYGPSAMNNSQELVTPSALEIAAAPGSISWTGNDSAPGAICIPSPVAYINRATGRVDNAPYGPPVTAGPSVVVYFDSNSTVWYHGVASCAGFH